MATRMLKVVKNVSDNVIPAIDHDNLLGLKTPPFDRCDMFMIAMAMGVEKGYKTEMYDKGTALIRETSVSGKNNALMTALMIEEAQTSNEIDKLADKDSTYSLAQDYANTGFTVLNELVERLQQGETNEDLIWDMISNLDSKYEELFSE